MKGDNQNFYTKNKMTRVIKYATNTVKTRLIVKI